jgi:hypothetical protein
VKFPVPFLVIPVLVLLVFACGCTMNASPNTGSGNLSGEALGTPTSVTIAPTGTVGVEPKEPEVPVETIVSKMITIVPKDVKDPVNAPPASSNNQCVFGSGNCHFYEQCMQSCISGGNSQGYCDVNICCSSKCFDLPTLKEKEACSGECLARAGVTQVTTVQTLIPL